MESLYNNQYELYEAMTKLLANIKKDGADRKTLDYCKRRIENLEAYWKDYQENDDKIREYGDMGSRYFINDDYNKAKELYLTIRNYIDQTIEYLSSKQILGHKAQQQSGEQKLLSSTNQPGTSTSTEAVQQHGRTSNSGGFSKLDEMIKKQFINFKAFERTVSSIDVSSLQNKWEYEDALSALNSRWSVIDRLHWDIQGETDGEDSWYESTFDQHEKTYNKLKKSINTNMWSVSHREKSTPQMDIPSFSGNYHQWISFKDLFNEAIHNNPSLSNAQKMQFLKGKVTGEAERLIYHLNISADNYIVCWDLLNHRYDNRRLIFTSHANILLSLPVMQQQSLGQIKKLHDVTKECLYAIKNLGVEIKTWDPLLVHVLSQKLDNDSYSEYIESVKKPRDLPDLNEFLTFLESKFTVLESSRRKQEPVQKSMQQYQPRKLINYNSISNNSNYHHYNMTPNNRKSVHVSTCALCNAEHGIFSCSQFRRMPDEQKLNTVTRLKYCVNCLYDHYNKPCISTKRCLKCNAHHNTLLHEAFNKPKPHAQKLLSRSTNNQPNSSHVSQENLSEILLATALIKVKGNHGTHVLRALIDQGSQISLITENAAHTLGLKRKPCKGIIFGVGERENNCKGLLNLQCGSMYSDFLFNANVLIMNSLIKNLPNRSITKPTWSHINSINLADPEFNISRPVDLLLGAEVYSKIILGGVLRGDSDDQPIAQQTQLGWLLCGSVKTFHCNVVLHNYEDLHKFWEIEDVDITQKNMTESDNYCEDFYQKTTERMPDGRYVVALPMKPDFEKELGSSKQRATAQFKQLENKLNKNSEFSESYKQFMREYIALDHMRPVSTSDQQTPHYLPHHGVLKIDSETTKLRVVFNASSKTSSGNSLNDLMYSGPNLQEDLQALILKWRTYQYVFTADIEKMFRTILLRASDQHLQVILWRESPCEFLQEYQLTTITYGMKAAPFLAMRTLKQLAEDETANYPLAAATIKDSFYTDDLMTGHNSLKKALQLREEIIKIFQSANMNLRKWSSNEPQLLQDLSPEKLNVTFEFKSAESRKTLGLEWNPTTDSFSYHKTVGETDAEITKRQLLSAISKLFDPLGWLSPLSIRAKLLFQRTWNKDLKWDEKVSPDINQDWHALKKDLSEINDFKISRHLGNTQNECHLHAFCDASDKAYACVLYLVTGNKGEYTSKLIAAKTRLTPLAKKVSLPRLELCGALLLSQLVQKVQESFRGIDIKIYAWSDSMIVLGWLNGDISRWKVFVANRVQQVTDVIPPSCWRHVRSEENPADCATRGLTKKQLLEHKLWWEGPDWLPTFRADENHTTSYQSPNIDVKQSLSSMHAALQQNNDLIIIQLLMQHSSLTRVTRVLGWVLRFIYLTRNKRNASRSEVLMSWELNKSHNHIIRESQNEDFGNDIDNIKRNGRVSSKSKIAPLNPFLDEHGLLRVGGRLSNSTISDLAKHPIILSSHARLTDLVINQAHITTLHGGPQLTLAHIRNQYWIISGMRTVKRQLRRCVRCRRFSKESAQNIMGDLPKPRVTPCRPFTHTGVDFTGHIEVKINKGRGVKTCKGYIAVFVCLSTKAVHLELVSDLSTPTFLSAFRRFCARRGAPRHMYSDNGTNFVGANRLLKKEYKEILQNINTQFFDNINDLDIEWHFNAPAWPSAGGLWEAAVKSMKHHLKRVLGEQKLTYEELSTLLHQIEACLNSRPLCQLTENMDDEYLTPGHFLVGGPLLSRPQTEPTSTTLPTRWQLVQAMNNHFWKRWSKEYLQNLQSRSKWRSQKKNLEIDDVVIIKEDNLPPGKWALGRVEDLHPGQDGIVRVVTLKTNNTHIKRPVSKLITLSVKEMDQTVDHQKTPQPQQSINQSDQLNTRQLRPRHKGLNLKNFFVTMLLLLFSSAISPSNQQTLDHAVYNKTSLNVNQGLFFDQIANLHYVKDEWKLVVYYNMTTYWQSVSNIGFYVDHLKELSKESYLNLQSITLQLEQEVKEMEHYNYLLRNPDVRRQKRGLVNGVGYIANALFGVLDERFAEQYRQDVEKIAKNENHLQNLLKNQTSVLESEYNILQRNEKIMTKQFNYINQRLEKLSKTINQSQTDNKYALYITSSALTANIIISNLRRMQETLIDTITDIYHGRIDMHLLLPQQLIGQMNLISGQLQGNLMLPVDGENVRDLYKLLKVAARVINNYFIIEVKIPLLSSDIFELNRIVSIPQHRNNKTYNINPHLPYIAYNVKKDVASLLTENDLRSCTHISDIKILCSLNTPFYDLKLKQSLCDIKLTSTLLDNDTCTTTITTCRDQWIKLHRSNEWLYACCDKCHVRIYCPYGMSIDDLESAGIISLGNGCLLKGTYNIYAHNNNLQNTINIQREIRAPKISMLNKIINTSLSETMPLEPNTSTVLWNQIRDQIEAVKEQSQNELSIHDIHHYTTQYIIVVLIIIGTCGGIYWRCRSARRVLRSLPEPAVQFCPRPREAAAAASDSESVSMPREASQSVRSVKCTATSPISFKSRFI